MTKKQKSSVVTIGMFDGVHRGHQKILRAVAADARRARAMPVVLTFRQHPKMLMGKGDRPPLIATLAQKMRMFAILGIRRAVVFDFNRKFSRIDPEDFVKSFLLDDLGMKELCVGYDFAFGRDRRGNHTLLKKMARQHGFRLRTFGPVRTGGTIVSSTAIRQLLKENKLDAARRLLGRWYSVEGVVEPGIGLGKALGFPTANIRVENDPIVSDGVYAVGVRGAGFSRWGVLSVGCRPTLFAKGAVAPRVWEIHLWDFHKKLYGKRLEVYLVEHLRPEKKFLSLAALSKQIARDIEIAKRIAVRHKTF